MAHFDGGTDFLIILLSVLGMYLCLAAALLIQDIFDRKNNRKMSSHSRSGKATPHADGVS